VQIR